MQARQFSLFSLQTALRCVRYLACLAAFASVSLAQQPAQDAGAKPPTQSLATAAVSAESEKPPIVQTPQQKQLADDTAKLLQLATELKTAVDKTTKDELSLEVIRKADEIERLAHDVKQRMKG